MQKRKESEINYLRIWKERNKEREREKDREEKREREREREGSDLAICKNQGSGSGYVLNVLLQNLQHSVPPLTMPSRISAFLQYQFRNKHPDPGGY